MINNLGLIVNYGGSSVWFWKISKVMICYFLYLMYFSQYRSSSRVANRSRAQ